MSHEPMTPRAKEKLYVRTALILILLLMTLLRLGYSLQVCHYPGFGRFLHPDDQAYYHATALKIADGHVLGEDGVITRAPGYLYFVGALYHFLAPDPGVAAVIQWCLGVLTGLMIYLLARRLFTEKTALTAALFYALYLPALCYEGALLMASLLTFLLTAGLYCLVRSVQDGSPRYLILSGALYGWAFLCRPNNLALFLAGLAFLGWSRGGKRAMFRFTAPAGALYGLLMIRNYLAGADLLAITSQGRHVMMNSHYHQAAGVFWRWPDSWNNLLNQHGNSLWGFLSFLAKDIVDHWPDWIGLQFSKLYAFFFNYEFSQFIDFYAQQEVLPILRLPSVSLGILSPLTIAGLVFLWRDRGGKYHRPLTLYFITGVLSVVFFYVLSRFRMPLIPLFCIISATALWRLPRISSGLGWKGRIGLAALLILLFFALNAESRRTAYAARSMPIAIYNRGVHYQAGQQYARAAADFQRVYSSLGKDTDPEFYFAVAMSLADCQERLKKPGRAAAVWHDLIMKFPDREQPYCLLGRYYAERGRYDQALLFLNQALELRPDDKVRRAVEKIRQHAAAIEKAH
ncbi:MAG: glycosyltransferase family 39 protein [Thermodesulfobacteriota bacterium]